MARFVKYLPEFGWQPRVLTVKNATAGRPRDDSLLRMVAGDVNVARVDPLFDLNVLQRKMERLHLAGVVYRLRKLLSEVPPDGELGVVWILSAYVQARKIVRREKIEVIFTSSPPLVAHVLGLLLKKETNLPWVADFRDEWSQHPQRCFRLPIARRADAWLEQSVLLAADHVTAATEAYKKGLSSSVSISPEGNNKFTTITNGFDTDDFTEDEPSSVVLGSEPVITHKEKFSVIYVGTLYGGIGFLTALQNLLADGRIPPEKIEFILVGRIHPIWKLDGALLMGKVSSLKPVIRQVGWVSHREAVRLISQADVLLLVLDSNRGASTIPGKVFEYMASGRPILGLVPPQSEVATLLKQTGCTKIIEPEDAHAIEEAVYELYEEWVQGKLLTEARQEKIVQYEAKRLAGSLAWVLDRVVYKP